MGFDSARRALSRSWGGAVAHLRSTANSPPMKASACRRALRIAGQGLEPVPARMGPAPDLDDLAARVQVVEDRVGVGDEIALVPAEELVDGGAVVLGRVCEQNVSRRRDHHPEMGAPALLTGLDPGRRWRRCTGTAP